MSLKDTIDTPVFWGPIYDCKLFLDRLEQYFEFYSMSDENKRGMVISGLSEDTYAPLRDACYPQKPGEKSYQELADILMKQYTNQTSTKTSDRCNFYSAKQGDNESVSDWFKRIQKLALKCKLGSAFGNILVLQFITGLQSLEIVNRLCQEDESQLDMRKALQISLAEDEKLK